MGKFLTVDNNPKNLKNGISTPFTIYHEKMDSLSFYSLSSAW